MKTERLSFPGLGVKFESPKKFVLYTVKGTRCIKSVFSLSVSLFIDEKGIGSSVQLVRKLLYEKGKWIIHHLLPMLDIVFPVIQGKHTVGVQNLSFITFEWLCQNFVRGKSSV